MKYYRIQCPGGQVGQALYWAPPSPADYVYAKRLLIYKPQTLNPKPAFKAWASTIYEQMLWCQVHAVAVLTQASRQNHTQPGKILLDIMKSALTCCLWFSESTIGWLMLCMHNE